MSERADGRRGVALVGLGSILLGTTGLFVVMVGDLSLTTILAYRLVLGSTALAGLMALSPRRRQIFRAPRKAWPHLVGLGILMVIIDLGFYTAILRVGVGLATILLYTAPLFVAGLSAVLLKERPTRRELLGVFVGFAGVVLIAAPERGAGVETLGLLGGLLAGAGWAGWLVTSRSAGEHDTGGEVQSLASHAVGAVFVVPVYLLWDPVVPSGNQLVLLLGLGLLASALGLFIVAWGLRLVDATRAAVVGYLEPLTAVVLGALVLSEQYGFADAAGSLLVIAGTLVVTLTPNAAAETV